MSYLDHLALFSHELRSPASGILGLSELLADGLDDRAASKEMVQLIRDNAEHLIALLDVLLLSARLDRGIALVKPTAVDVWDLVGQVIRTLTDKAQRKQLDLRAETLGAIPQHVRTDETLLRQILSNLIDNAIRYTDEGGIAVLLRQRDTDQGLVLDLTVADSGIGMDHTQTSRLFRRFEQVHDPLKGDRGGSGIGLWACDRLATALGAELSVRSQPDLGSRFRIRLPLAQPIGPSHEPGCLQARTALPIQRIIPDHCRVALLTADPCIKLQVAAPLKEAGSAVQLIADPAELQDDLTQLQLALIDIDGPAAWSTEVPIRWRRHHGDLNLIGLAQASEVPDRLRYLSVGFDDIIAKPISRNRLLELVAAALDES